MSLRHTVNRGESLWCLSHRYLGCGTRWPDIYHHHNEEVTQLGPYRRLLAIKDPNLIYVGQTIIIPLRSMNSAPGTGKKLEASTIATGLGVKLEYNFENGKNPIKYKPKVTNDYTITSEMTGKMTLKASIAAHANIGPYKFEVKADAPNHFTYTLKPQPISAIVENNQRRYKYSAEIAFKVDVTLHPKPRNKSPQTVQDPFRQPFPSHSKTHQPPWRRSELL